ncbi:MAG: glycosyltransferase, partial [Deltaproteobacteria bacterium]|nr:glycosyltransferase [Deltaproteobacteria bacterium]
MNSKECNFSEIAVIIPAFNEEQAIGDLIEELRQCIPDVHIVVINDGSGD